MQKYECINWLKDKMGYTSYVELGYLGNDSFNNITVKEKKAVDPNIIDNKNVYNGNIDAFIRTCISNDIKYDIILMNNEFRENNSFTQFLLCRNILNKNGAILFNNVNPYNEWFCRPYEQYLQDREYWCGNIWRAFVRMRNTNRNISFTFEVEHGLGVYMDINTKDKIILPPLFNYRWLEKNRHYALKIMNINDINNLINNHTEYIDNKNINPKISIDEIKPREDIYKEYIIPIDDKEDIIIKPLSMAPDNVVPVINNKNTENDKKIYILEEEETNNNTDNNTDNDIEGGISIEEPEPTKPIIPVSDIKTKDKEKTTEKIQDQERKVTKKAKTSKIKVSKKKNNGPFQMTVPNEVDLSKINSIKQPVYNVINKTNIDRHLENNSIPEIKNNDTDISEEYIDNIFNENEEDRLDIDSLLFSDRIEEVKKINESKKVTITKKQSRIVIEE